MQEVKVYKDKKWGKTTYLQTSFTKPVLKYIENDGDIEKTRWQEESRKHAMIKMFKVTNYGYEHEDVILQHTGVQ